MNDQRGRDDARDLHQHQRAEATHLVEQRRQHLKRPRKIEHPMSDSKSQSEPGAESDIAARYQVEIPTVKSLFIEVRYGDTVLGNAMGFLAAHDQQSHCALITNRHVVTGRHQESGECLHSQGGIPDNIIYLFS